MLEFFIGAIIGALIVMFIVSCDKNDHDNEAYMEGFLDGKKCRLESEIRTIKAEAEYCRELHEENNHVNLLIEGYGYKKKAEAFDACVMILEKSCEREKW
jgi:hypothetical protein